jgi:hypothetical protein
MSDTYKSSGKMLAVKIEYGTYDFGRNVGKEYDDVLYEFIQRINGNYTTDGGKKPEFLYLFDSKRISKEDLASAIRNEMGYTIYLKEHIDTKENIEIVQEGEL